MSYKKSLLYALNATCRDFPRYIFIFFCMAVCYTRLLSLGMAVCDYASLVTLIQKRRFLGKTFQKLFLR